jgi:predicted transcriptional regulator
VVEASVTGDVLERLTRHRYAAAETLLDARGWLTVGDIARACGVNEGTVREVLTAVKARGWLMTQPFPRPDKPTVNAHKLRPLARQPLRELLAAAD